MDKVNCIENYHGTLVADPIAGWKTVSLLKARHGLGAE